MITQFLEIVKSKLGAGYVFGGQSDRPLTKEALQKLVNTFGRRHYYFLTFNAEKWMGKEYYDCSGLIVYTLSKLGLIQCDYTASALYYKLCKTIDKSELRPGDFVFVKNLAGTIDHVGVYIGDNQVIHARGTKYGVVQTNLLSSFNVFGRCKLFKEPEMAYPDALKIVCPALDTPYGFWLNRPGLDDTEKALIIKMAKYIKGELK